VSRSGRGGGAGPGSLDAGRVETGGGGAAEGDVDGESGPVEESRTHAGRAEVDLDGLAVDEDAVQVRPGFSGEGGEEELEEEALVEGQRAGGRPEELDLDGVLVFAVGIRDGLGGAAGGRRGRREFIEVDDVGGGGGELGRDAVEHGPEGEQARVVGEAGVEGADHSHVVEAIVARVEVADVFGGHLADAFGEAAGLAGEGVLGAVEDAGRGAPEAVVGASVGADHLVVDGAAFLEGEGAALGVGGNGVVVDLAADLLVGVVGVEERGEAGLEDGEERLPAHGCVEVVGGAGALGERRGLREVHGLEACDGAAVVALSEEEVLLGVGFAAVGVWDGLHPDEGLGHGLDLEEVEDEARALVGEASAHGLAAVVQVERAGLEAGDDLAFGEGIEGRRGGRLGRGRLGRGGHQGEEEGARVAGGAKMMGAGAEHGVHLTVSGSLVHRAASTWAWVTVSTCSSW
jgi:hypothetical protein